MTFVAGASAHGSPGVSTALQLVASLWADSSAVPVVVEGDASGGVLAARYEVSLMPGFVTLVESLRKSEQPSLLDHAQRLPSGVACVALSPSATAAGAQLRSAGPYLGSYLAQAGHPVLFDAGTVVPDGRAVPVLSAADLLLWFVRPTREELLVLRHRLAECSQPENVAGRISRRHALQRIAGCRGLECRGPPHAADRYSRCGCCQPWRRRPIPAAKCARPIVHRACYSYRRPSQDSPVGTCK